MKSKHLGFTMVELIVVIVILGILAAIALPKFIDVEESAENKALAGVAAAMGSAMSVNYGGCLITSQVATVGKCVAIADCDQIGNLLQGGVFPEGYYVQQANLPMRGSLVTCTVVHINSGKTATFEGIGTVNN